MINQYRVPGRGDQGAHTEMYVSCKVPGKVHIIVPDNSIHVDVEDLKKLIRDLFPVDGVKHAGTL